MLLEDLLILLAGVSGVFFIGLPLWKLMRLAFPSKRDPLAEAKQRLEIARAEAEAAKLNKEAERVYNEIYQEVLEDQISDETTTNNKGRVQ
jgi:hypothetical protein